MKKIILILTIVLIITLIILYAISSIRKNTDSSSNSSNIIAPTTFLNRPGSQINNSNLNTAGILNVSVTPAMSIKQSDIDKLKSLLPYQNNDFSISYSAELDKFIFVKKTANAEASILKWSKANDIPSLYTYLLDISTQKMFLVKDLTTTNTKNTSGTSNQPSISQRAPTSTKSNTSTTPFGGTTPGSQNSSYSNLAINNITNNQRLNLQKIKSNLPDNADFTVVYSDALDVFIIQMKTAGASEKINEWATQNSISNLVNNSAIFVKTISSPIDFADKVVQGVATNESQTPPTPALAKAEDTLRSIYSTLPNITAEEFYGLKGPTPTTDPSQFDPDGTLITNPGGETPVVTSDILKLIESYGLPPPVAGGSDGYNAFRQKILSDKRALWATTNVLEGERLYAQKGGSIYRYLTTAWVWMETGLYWPNVYEINCRHNRSLNQVSTPCDSTNFQIAGYQASDQRNNYVRIFKLLYGDTDVKTVMQQVVDNCTNALFVEECYLDGAQKDKDLVARLLPNGKVPSDVSLNDILPNGRGFFDPRTQFYTLLLGKDPKMAAALNAITVKDIDDMPNRIFKIPVGSSKRTSWANYIREPQMKIYSNLIVALYLIETNASEIIPPSTVVQTTPPPSQHGSNGYVLYLQTDPKYNPPSLGKCGNQGLMKYAGCGPTTTSMIISTFTGQTFTPLDAAKEYKYFTCEGTTVQDARDTLTRHGVKISKILFDFETAQPLSKVEGVFKQYLAEGWTFFVLLPNHFIWVTNVDDKGNVYSQDPYYGQSRAIQPKEKNWFEVAFAVRPQ